MASRGQRGAAFLALGQPELIDPDVLALRGRTSISVNKVYVQASVSEIKGMYFKMYLGKVAEACDL